MILAHYGVSVAVEELVQRAALQPGGMAIPDLVNLAGQYGLTVRAERVDPPAIAALIAQDIFPIVYLQLPIAGKPTAHAVIPVNVSSTSVCVLDPLLPPPGERQFLIPEFTAAQHWLGQSAVICHR